MARKWTYLPCGVLLAFAVRGVMADYQLQRVASGLAQPVYMTQAPGDPANIIYYMTRISATSGTGGGFGTVNNMGGIFRYDMNTRTSTQVMSLSFRQLTGDEGPNCFAFSPDFNTPGAPGFQKMYVSSSQRNTSGNPIDRVEEYTVSGAGGTVPLDGSNHPIVSNLVLQYTHNVADANHTVDWIGFDPTSASQPIGTAQRNYLYISTGDGSINASAQVRPEQQANSVAGKLLRVDVDVAHHGDAYASDANKNFAIPSTNPIPLWNANHNASQQLTGSHLNYTGGSPTSADYTPALGEVFATGTRNQFRVSIDRTTGDIWMGDVGENSREEVNFIKANPNAANNFEKANPYDGTQLPYDFGYASREGTIPTSSTGNVSTVASAVANSAGSTSLVWNLSGGGTLSTPSINPIREGAHRVGGSNISSNTTGEIRDTNRSAYIGGYLYRGPIPELQGKYVYTDFVNGNTFSLDFDRNTSLSSYSGTNFNQAADTDGTDQVASLGTRTVVANRNTGSLWQSLIVDPNDPSYTASIGSAFGLGRVVSFGEDNAGNLYVIDFGGARGDTSFNNDYPNAGTGEIFKLVAVPEPSAALLLAPAALLFLRRRRRTA